ncbi:MAG: hypothetical protein WKF77_21430 [Planctomycetaceae bacterium]
MQRFDVCLARNFRLILTMVFLTACGCDQVGSVVDDVKSTVTETTQPSTTPAPQAAPVMPTPTLPPTPEQLLAEFNSLNPQEITDVALARITSRPEAASAITELQLFNEQISRAGLGHLSAMENLASLTLRNSTLLPEDLSVLGQVTSLKVLGIGSTRTNDVVVGNLTTLAGLESLDLSNTAISPAAGASLSRFTNLHVLNLASTPADDSTVAAISSLPIRDLMLSRTRISNASLAIIRQFRSLESLQVPFCAVTGDAFKGYGGSGLKVLNVGETSFGIEGFSNIKGMKSLENLNVYQAGLLEHTRANVFRTFPNLKILNAGSNAITNAGMDVFFKGHKSLEELHLHGNKGISDQGLASLIAVKTLRVLDVHDTGCTANGATALKAKLPDCKIIITGGTF